MSRDRERSRKSSSRASVGHQRQKELRRKRANESGTVGRRLREAKNKVLQFVMKKKAATPEKPRK